MRKDRLDRVRVYQARLDKARVYQARLDRARVYRDRLAMDRLGQVFLDPESLAKAKANRARLRASQDSQDNRDNRVKHLVRHLARHPASQDSFTPAIPARFPAKIHQDRLRTRASRKRAFLPTDYTVSTRHSPLKRLRLPQATAR